MLVERERIDQDALALAVHTQPGDALQGKDVEFGPPTAVLRVVGVGDDEGGVIGQRGLRIEDGDPRTPGLEDTFEPVDQRACSQHTDVAALVRPASERVHGLALLHLEHQAVEERGRRTVRTTAGSAEGVEQLGGWRVDQGESSGAQADPGATVGAEDEMGSRVGERQDAGFGSHGFSR